MLQQAELFDRLAGPRARVLVMGPRSSTWLQIFAEVATNLSAHNFTGLSRHYANEARELIARKLDVRVTQRVPFAENRDPAIRTRARDVPATCRVTVKNVISTSSAPGESLYLRLLLLPPPLKWEFCIFLQQII
jgi:hypothetical protein